LRPTRLWAFCHAPWRTGARPLGLAGLGGRVCAHVYFGGLPTAVGLFAVLVYFSETVAPLPALDFLPAPWRTGARQGGPCCPLPTSSLTNGPLRAPALRAKPGPGYSIPSLIRFGPQHSPTVWACGYPRRPRCAWGTLSTPASPSLATHPARAIPALAPNRAGILNSVLYRFGPGMAITGSASCLTAPPTVAASARQRGAGSS